MLETLQRLVPERFRKTPERGAKELSPEAYLAGLKEPDKQQVLQFVEFIHTLRERERLHGVRIGVLAIGSTTRFELDRHRSARDIDLRILNSAPMNSEQRKIVIGDIVGAIRDHLRQEGIDFEESKYTAETRMVAEDSKKKLVPFVDYDNNNTSFVTKPKEGLQLHISVSGINAWDLDRHIGVERRRGESFAVLMKDEK